MLNIILKKLFWGGLRHFLSDKLYIMVRYRLEFGFFPDLKNPKRFSEKIQYLKLNDRIKLRKLVADRRKVRDYVKEKTGTGYLIPLYGMYTYLDDQIWETLPASFVLKASHGSGLVKIVRDKRRANKETILCTANQWLRTNYYRLGREWVYKDLERFIIVEELLLNEQGETPPDFKFFCFQGEVKLVQVDLHRFSRQKRNLYDREFNRIGAGLHHPVSSEEVEKPSLFNEAVVIAEKLSEEFNFIRVDLYILDERIYFGELTNYPGNGFEKFSPDEFDFLFGEMLKL